MVFLKFERGQKINKLFVCIVLYQHKMEYDPKILKLRKGYKLLFVDNSPEFNLKLYLNIEYYPMKENEGLTVAYNLVFYKAKEQRYRYLMSLDQDTEITTK